VVKSILGRGAGGGEYDRHRPSVQVVDGQRVRCRRGRRFGSLGVGADVEAFLVYQGRPDLGVQLAAGSALSEGVGPFGLSDGVRAAAPLVAFEGPRRRRPGACAFGADWLSTDGRATAISCPDLNGLPNQPVFGQDQDIADIQVGHHGGRPREPLHARKALQRPDRHPAELEGACLDLDGCARLLDEAAIVDV